MPKILSFIFLIFALTSKCQGYQDRIQIPIQQMPSASNDIFNWRMPDGAYQFGMQGHDQWRVEKRYPNGGVYVHFAYKTPDGKIHSSAYTSGMPQAVNLRESPDKTGHKYEKFETSDKALEDKAIKLSLRNIDIDSEENTKKENIENATNVHDKNYSTNAPVNSEKTIEEKDPKPKNKTIKMQLKKTSLLDNYVQKQKEAEVSKSRSFYGISFNIQKPQKSSSVKEALVFHTLPNGKLPELSPEIAEYENRRSRLNTPINYRNFKKSNKILRKNKAVAITLF